MLVSDGAVSSSIFIQSDNALTCMALVLASGPQTILCNETVCVVVSTISSPKMFSSWVLFHENIKRCASVWFISVWGTKKDFTIASCFHARGRCSVCQNVQCHIFFGPGLIVFFGDVTCFLKSIPGVPTNIFSYLAL
jgi:hypothetical protein